MNKENNSERIKKLNFAVDEIFKIDEDLFVILKAHLVAEHFLYEILNNTVPNPNAINNSRLSFHQLLSIVEAHRPSKKEVWIWGALRNLNSLRNEIAHTLSTDKFIKKRDLFIVSTEPWVQPPEGTKDIQRLKFILTILCAQLANILHGVPSAGPTA
jgi:hypothetical protein